MRNRRSVRRAAALACAACAAATGIMGFVTFGAAPALFRVYPRATAGEITGVLFPWYYLALYTLGGIALAGLVAGRGGLRHAAPALAAAALGVGLVAGMDHGIGPVLDGLRSDRAAFARWHGAAMAMNLGALIAFGVACALATAQADEKGIPARPSRSGGATR